MPTTATNKSTELTLTAVPLTAEAFAPYGDVIELTDKPNPINQGKGWRHSDLARIDTTADDGRTATSLVTCLPEEAPVPLRLMERHPLGSQVFMPVNGQRYIVVVAPSGKPPRPQDIRAFLASGDQGINYHRGVWHHPMIALDSSCTFFEVHRAGPGKNCDESPIDAHIQVQLPNTDSGSEP